MTINILSETLSRVVDESYLPLLLQVDEHLQKKFEAEASPSYKKVMEEFERARQGSIADLAIYLLIIEAMKDENVRAQQIAGGV